MPGNSVRGADSDCAMGNVGGQVLPSDQVKINSEVIQMNYLTIYKKLMEKYILIESDLSRRNAGRFNPRIRKSCSLEEILNRTL